MLVAVKAQLARLYPEDLENSLEKNIIRYRSFEIVTSNSRKALPPDMLLKQWTWQMEVKARKLLL